MNETVPALEQHVLIEPIIHYPRRTICSHNYMMTVDVRLAENINDWPYAEEEYALYCIPETYPLFHYEALDEPAVTLHRFGGTYGPITFLLTASSEPREGSLMLRFTNGSGVPITTVELHDVHVVKASSIYSTAMMSGFTGYYGGGTYGLDNIASHRIPPEAAILQHTITTRNLSKSLTNIDQIQIMDFSPDGTLLALAIGGYSASVVLWNLTSKRVLSAFHLSHSNEREELSSIYFLPNGSELIVCRGDTISTWDVHTGSRLGILKGNSLGTLASFSPKNKADNSAGIIPMLDINYRNGEQRISADGTLLVEYPSSANRDLEDAPVGWGQKTFNDENPDEIAPAYVWNLETRKQIAILSGHTGAIINLAISPDNHLVAIASRDASIYIWSLNAS